MRKTYVRRIVAALVLSLGIGAAVGATPATAATPTHATVVKPTDWYWGP